MNIKSFTGNGLIFPPGRGPWYRDPELTEPVTDNQCGRGETLYRYDYTSGSTRGTVAQKATASNAGLATASNGSAQSSGYPASGSTLWNQETAGIYGAPKATGSNALLYWEDGFQDTWEDEEMLEELEQELVNDLFQAAALPIPPGTLPLPFKQSRPDNRLFYIPEDNRPWRPGQKR